MDKKKYRTHNIKEKIILYILKTLLVVCFSGGIYYCWIEFYNPYIPTPFFRLGNYLMGALMVAIYISFVKVYGGFLVGTSPVWDLIFSQIIAIGFQQAFCYVIFSLLSYKLVSIWPFVIMLVVFSVVAAIWCYLADFLYYKIHKPKRTIVVYGNVDSYRSLQGVKSMDKRFTVIKTVDCKSISLNELFAQLASVDAVFLCGVHSDYRNEVVKFCIANGKVAYVKPKISDTIIRGGRTIQLLNVPVYRCRRSDQGIIYLFLKRLADIVLSFIALVISLPVTLLTALAVKLYDGGDVFYKQVRLTTNGKTFRLIKFRSMVQDAEKDGVARLASEGDSRITPVGKFIRKTRLDELPQLINIFKGDMSFVGPRPERPEIAAQYEKDMPEFALRLQVKAGLTGYAQVYGKYNTPPYDKVQMDLMYIANQSLFEDMRLMLMTFKIMFVPSSTQGIGEDETDARGRKSKAQEKEQ